MKDPTEGTQFMESKCHPLMPRIPGSCSLDALNLKLSQLKPCSTHKPLIYVRTVKEKRAIYGKHRIAVGGTVQDAGPDDDQFTGLGVEQIYVKKTMTDPPVPVILPGRKSETSKEPVFFHSGPYALDEELVAGHAIGAINDLTPGALTH